MWMPFRSTSAQSPSAVLMGSDVSGARAPWTRLWSSSFGLPSSQWSGSSIARNFSPSTCARRKRGWQPPAGSVSSCWPSRTNRRRRWRLWPPSSSRGRRLFAPSSPCSRHESSAARRYCWEAKRSLSGGYRLPFAFHICIASRQLTPSPLPPSLLLLLLRVPTLSLFPRSIHSSGFVHFTWREKGGIVEGFYQSLAKFWF